MKVIICLNEGIVVSVTVDGEPLVSPDVEVRDYDIHLAETWETVGKDEHGFLYVERCL